MEEDRRPVVGVVGRGFIGKAHEDLFRDVLEVLAYDKFVPGGASIEEVVGRSDVVFVAVPTPMRRDGSCHTAIVESVLADLAAAAAAVKRPLEQFVVVLKSTVPPGFTTAMSHRHRPMRLVFSPEFLTERNASEDFRTSNRLVLGGSYEDAFFVRTVFDRVWHDRIAPLGASVDHPDGPVAMVQCDPEVAEMTKLFTNAALTVRVMFANEMFQVCSRMGISYDDVKAVACLDERVGDSHLDVPGPDGDLGYGGHCFVKDIYSLRHVCRRLGVNEKLFTATIERNDELRTDRDWEKMKDRAVIDE